MGREEPKNTKLRREEVEHRDERGGQSGECPANVAAMKGQL